MGSARIRATMRASGTSVRPPTVQCGAHLMCGNSKRRRSVPGPRSPVYSTLRSPASPGSMSSKLCKTGASSLPSSPYAAKDGKENNASPAARIATLEEEEAENTAGLASDEFSWITGSSAPKMSVENGAIPSSCRLGRRGGIALGEGTLATLLENLQL